MRSSLRSLVHALVLLSLAATSAAAAGVNLRWNDCGAAGATNKTFACTSNVLFDAVMIGSFVAPAGTTLVTGTQVVLDLQSASATLPAWWQFKNPGTCRQAAFSINADFTGGPANCTDHWQGLASGGFTAFDPNVAPGQPNRARIVAVFASAQQFEPVSANVEYGAFKIVLNATKTVGAGACAGCLEPVCIVLNEIQLAQPVGLGDHRLQNPADAGNFVTWQGGVVTGGCPAATPARNTTWGSVKSLYP